MPNELKTTALSGTTYEVYHFLLIARKPVSIRDVQRALTLSSPSVAMYHLSKLERMGFVKRESGNFVVARVLLENMVKINRFLIPRSFFYAFFSITALIIELTFFRPYALNSTYFFSVMVIAAFTLMFCFETLRTWLRGNL